MRVVSGKARQRMNKWVIKIKTIYQDISTEHDGQLKRLVEEIRNGGYEEGIEDAGDDDLEGIHSREERGEAEA